MQKILVFLFCLIFSTHILATNTETIHLKQGHPIRYTVKPEDTLWGIASQFLDDPSQWPLLIETDPQTGRPEKIYPGEVLVLGLNNGKPVLRRENGGTIKLYPHVRSTFIGDAIRGIPEEAIRPFLDGSGIVTKNELLSDPYILATAGEHVANGLGDKVFVNGIKPDNPDTKFSIFRQGDPYVDPKTHEILGYAALHVGQAELLEPGDTSLFQIIQSVQEILPGDRLVPFHSEEILRMFVLSFPDNPIKGQIIGVLYGITQIGQFDIVVLNRGTKDGLKMGDLLTIYTAGKTVRDPWAKNPNAQSLLPSQRSGVLVVFRAFDRASFALVLKAVDFIHVLDEVRSPNL